jgi:hypothetical protein
MAGIPLSWNDPMFNGVTSSSNITVKNGGTVSNKSITDTGDIASIVGQGSFTIDQVRINSQEGVRIGGAGDMVINNSYIETTGIGDDHADGIQAYSPGSSGNLTINNTTIVSHTTAANAGLFIADNYGGSVTLNNVVFQGGPIGLRIAADNQDVTVALKDVYFVGPFMYEPLLLQNVNANVHVTQWENVRYATIVNGQLVPGALIPSPFPVEGGTTTPPVQDLVAPDIASWSPDSGKTGDGVTNADKITLKGTAAANSTVKIYDGSTQIGTAKAAADGSWSYITSVLTDAKHTLTATATNSSGQTSSASSAVAITVDTKAPTAPSISTNAGANGAVANGAAMNVKGSAEAKSSVAIYDGNTKIGTVTAGADGAWTFATNSLSTGQHTLTAKATDAAGNVSAASSAVKVSVTETTPTSPSAPKIASFSNDTGKVGDGITSDNTLKLDGTATGNSTVTIYDGAQKIGTAKADSSGGWSFTTGALSDGSHNLTAKATDATGKMGDASAVTKVTIDTHAPDAPSLGVFTADGKALNGPVTVADVTLKGTAEASSLVKLYDAGKLIGEATTKSDGTWSFDPGHLSNGDHKFAAIASDVAGNTSASSATKAISVAESPASSAGIDLTKVYQGSNNSVVIKGTADAYSQIKIFDGTKAIGSVKANADGDWSYGTGPVSSKYAHTFSAQELDKSGQVVSTSGSAIVGTRGADTLKGTSGNDTFIGNGHPDTFVFAPNFGNDTIKDFRASGPSHDVVQFSKSMFDNFADVLSHATQSGHDVVIASGHDTLTLKNTKIAALDKSDFHFA